ncbi:MAG: BlaI/MecI/CopY family transcriptional regulator [Candidatus Bathyarchaeota archaeon]|nr:BlaI/MecI/CopY family transcriptional regulator [Candidatus Bathyarchaeota archaeon]
MVEGDYTPSGYRIDREDLESFLGPLEAEVLNKIWEKNVPVRVREIYEELKEKRKIAYTTVMTTMNTLYEKGLLDRRIEKGRGGLLYVYWSKMSKKEIERSVVRQVINSLLKNFGNSVTSYLMEITDSDEEKLNAFKKLFEERLENEKVDN